MSHSICLAEYIWLDGNPHVTQIRSKSKVLYLPQEPSDILLSHFSEWSFDGSSTCQAMTDHSDCYLQPVYFVKNPMHDTSRNVPRYLVLCEVFDAQEQPHPTNSRAILRDILAAGADQTEAWFGFEQEYTMFKNNIPLGWPTHGYPAPQGPYYCGVGTEQIFGRPLAELHADMCIQAGLLYYGMNAEVMPGQWEFQIGYRDIQSEPIHALLICDHLWIARWMLHYLSEQYKVHVSFDNKPIKGDWNGSGLHTNFSTNTMRDPKTAENAIPTIIEKLSHQHQEHIEIYGYKLAERLTGLHETSNMHEFSCGPGHRGSSLRIPPVVVKKGHGYLEDRRPGANADPYLVAARILATICDLELKRNNPRSSDGKSIKKEDLVV